MSKCGYCGFEGNIGEHTVLECRTKSIPKVLYERMCVWMANEENPEDFYESFEGQDTGILSVQEHAEVDQKEEAMDIMYELTQIYQRKEQ
jgi:hypothetical protein